MFEVLDEDVISALASDIGMSEAPRDGKTVTELPSEEGLEVVLDSFIERVPFARVVTETLVDVDVVVLSFSQ